MRELENFTYQKPAYLRSAPGMLDYGFEPVSRLPAKLIPGLSSICHQTRRIPRPRAPKIAFDAPP